MYLPRSDSLAGLAKVLREPYVVCEKSDGERAMLYITAGECALAGTTAASGSLRIYNERIVCTGGATMKFRMDEN